MTDMLIDAGEGRSMENPNIPLGSPEVWNEVFGTNTADTGEAVTAKRALSLAPVWQAVSLISGDVAKLPLNVYRRRPDLGERGREIDVAHAAQNLLRWKANPHMASFKLWRRVMTHALLYGNAYCLIDRDANGVPLGLYPLLPDRTQPQLREDGSMFFVSEIGGELVTFFDSQVLHIEHVSIRGDADCELVSIARNSLALGLAQNKFASRFFQHGARIGGILEVPPGMTKVAADNLEQGFRKTYEAVDNAFKTVILREGSKFHAGQFNAQEAQMIAARGEQVKDVARWYNLPPHKLGDDSRTSYSSLEQENRSYLDSCLSPWLHTIQAECWMKLLTTPEQDAGTHFVEHNIDALIQADTMTKYQVGRMGIEMGVLSPDEFRAMQNMNPRPDGKGGVYLRPLNMAVAGEEEADQDQDAAVDATRHVMLDAIDDAVGGVLGVVTRAVKRKTANRFCTWVDSGLDVDTMELVQGDLATAVMAYCAIRKADPVKVTTAVMDSMYSRLHHQLHILLESNGTEEIKSAVVDNAASLRVDLPELILHDVEKDTQR